MLERLKQILHIKGREKETSVYDRIDSLFSSLNEDIICIEIGEDLVPFGKDICEVIDNVREEIKDELGFIMPAVRVRDVPAMQENEYIIKVKNKPVSEGYVVPNKSGVTDEIYESLKNVLLNNFKTILTNELTEKYIESARAKNGLLIWDITGAISTTEIRIILGDLLENGKSIKDISNIFEKISEQIYIENKYDYRNPHKMAEKIIKHL